MWLFAESQRYVEHVMNSDFQENNFKSTLESIQDLTQLNIVVPSWFESVFLGYDNDMSSSHYKNMPIQLKSLDFRDTFLHWDHLQKSFPTKVYYRRAAQLM
jgi:intron-binding protein aquarius